MRQRRYADFLAAALFFLYSTHRFFVAALIRARAAALILGCFFALADGADVSYFNAAQRFRCASTIRRRPAALIRGRFLGTADAAPSGIIRFTTVAARTL
jgi:hypothetical protein